MPETGGYLVPPEFEVFILMKAHGIDSSELPPLPGPEAEAIDARIARRNPIWRWLYHRLWKSKLATFVVFQFPRVPSVNETHRRRDEAAFWQRAIRNRALHALIEAKKGAARV